MKPTVLQQNFEKEQSLARSASIEWSRSAKTGYRNITPINFTDFFVSGNIIEQTLAARASFAWQLHADTCYALRQYENCSWDEWQQRKTDGTQ